MGTTGSHTKQELREQFSERERVILRLMAEGLSNQEIADRLFLALTTIKWYIRQINDKLDTHSRTQTVARARQLKLVGESDTAKVEQAEKQEPPENPYKGLRAFHEADAADFFGRDALIRQLVARLREPGALFRFLAVVGPSGSGKSSVVKAGLIPALRRSELPGSERWFIAEILPGAHPLEELEIALLRLAPNPPPSLLPQLRDDERGLLRAVRRVLPDDDSILALVIDQFEEVFTLVENQIERQHFLDSLCAAVLDNRSPLRVIITLRADFYDRPLMHTEFGSLMNRRSEAVLPLTAEELEQVITRPAAHVGVSIEPGLMAAIVAEVNQQPGALPLLQYGLTELFDYCQGAALTLEAYRAIGGMTGALGRRADALYQQLDANGREMMRQLFLRLVTLGEGIEDTRRRVSQAELVSIGADSGKMDDIIQTVAAYRLLTLDHDPATRAPTVELAHEAIIREWRRLRSWLDDSRADIRQQRLVANAAIEWQTVGRDPGFLLTGSRLMQFQEWAANTALALAVDERAYLQASIAEYERQMQIEQARQMREYTLERRSRTFLRVLVVLLLLATLGAFGLTGVAVNQSNIARQNEAEARGLALASSAQLALNEGNIEQAIAQAQAALQINDNTLARRVLDLAAYAPGTSRIFQEIQGFTPRALTTSETDLSFMLIAHGGEGDSFWERVMKGMEGACALLNANCQWFGTHNGDWDNMAGYWEQALALNPDGIGTTNIDPDIIGSGLDQAAERGIPVAVFNVPRGLESGSSLPNLLYIGSDEFVSSTANARRIIEEARADGVTIQRGVCATERIAKAVSFIIRCAAFQRVFDDEHIALDQIEIYIEGTDTSHEEVLNLLADYFTQHPETNVIFLATDFGAFLYPMYIQQAGLQPGQLYATTFDTSPEIFQMIRDGYVLQTIDQQPYMQGFQTIMSLYLYRQYGIRPSGFINTSSVVDQSNVDYVTQLVSLGYR